MSSVRASLRLRYPAQRQRTSNRSAELRRLPCRSSPWVGPQARRRRARWRTGSSRASVPAAHRRFLETQGFTVASAAHGDDALALLRRQPYSVVLLDEQMPGRRGLELIGEIRAIDPAMPVVMVTQSEDEGTLRDAIGIEVDDYLVKPVHPRQILSVVTRLLDGARIRQQRLARDFVTRSEEHTSELQSRLHLVCR